MKKNNKTKKLANEIAERQKFLDVYSEFDRWMRSIGFRFGNYKEGSTPADFLYSHYSEHIDSLYAVELYLHDIIKLSIRLIRDRYEHKLMFVGDIGAYSKVYTLDEAKELILEDVRKLRDKKLAELKTLENI